MICGLVIKRPYTLSMNIHVHVHVHVHLKIVKCEYINMGPIFFADNLHETQLRSHNHHPAITEWKLLHSLLDSRKIRVCRQLSSICTETASRESCQKLVHDKTDIIHVLGFSRLPEQVRSV